jgi:hypothetical protein
MEVKALLSSKFELPESLLNEYYHPELAFPFNPQKGEKIVDEALTTPSLFSVDLYKTLDWLHSSDCAKPFEKEVCRIPVLLFVPDFSIRHLLFHYDGTPQSAELIRKFIRLFSNLILESKATIISPSFIPKSKIKEEQELIQLISSHTKETSFIKFNFSRMGDFWSYAVKHQCTLLVTSNNHKSDLVKILFQFYEGEIGYDKLSFYLSA